MTWREPQVYASHCDGQASLQLRHFHAELPIEYRYGEEQTKTGCAPQITATNSVAFKLPRILWNEFMLRIPAGTHDAARPTLASRRPESRPAVMTVCQRRGLLTLRIRDARSQARMRAAVVVVSDPLRDDGPGGEVHSEGSANPDIRDACSHSTARKMRSPLVPAPAS